VVTRGRRLRALDSVPSWNRVSTLRIDCTHWSFCSLLSAHTRATSGTRGFWSTTYIGR
jgi:hypothetical protein